MKLILIFFFILPLYAISQSNIGVLHYGEIQSMGMGAPVGADYNAILIFNNSSSLYITRQDSLEGGHQYKINTYNSGENTTMQTYVTNEIGFRYYNDTRKDSFYSRDIGFKMVKEKTPNIMWSLKPETKNIGKFNCKKATALFRGRNYTAWYSPEIPLPYGPWKLQGLPGLILEAYDTDKEIFWYFKSLEYPSNLGFLLNKIPNKQNQWISFEEYRNYLVKKFNESLINSRMVSQSAGIDISQRKSMLNTYIEEFNLE